MGLSISTGLLADLSIHDPEGAEWFKRSLEKLNILLEKHDLTQHEEPTHIVTQPSRGGGSSFPYRYLHYLRRAAAYARHKPEAFGPNPADSDPAEDPLLEQVLFECMDSHLICHSDCEGLYVPIDFEEPLFAEEDCEVPGGIVGSTQGLQRELVDIAPLLGISLEGDALSDKEAHTIASEDSSQHPLGIERRVWFTLYEATRVSLAQGTVIVFH